MTTDISLILNNLSMFWHIDQVHYTTINHLYNVKSMADVQHSTLLSCLQHKKQQNGTYLLVLELFNVNKVCWIN